MQQWLEGCVAQFLGDPPGPQAAVPAADGTARVAAARCGLETLRSSLMPASARTYAVPVPVPHPKQIRDLFLGLTGKDIEVGPVNPVLPGRDPALVAVYVTDKLATGAAVACDLPLAAYAGAALGLVPLPRAQECIESGVLSEDLTENFNEVVNIM